MWRLEKENYIIQQEEKMEKKEYTQLITWGLPAKIIMNDRILIGRSLV